MSENGCPRREEERPRRFEIIGLGDLGVVIDVARTSLDNLNHQFEPEEELLTHPRGPNFR
jgi:hypothetical protein